MEYYEQAHRHIIRPSDPSRRLEADRVRVTDFEALYLVDLLVEYASYEAGDATEETIAMGYAEHINTVIRENGEGFMYLYTHTPTAKDVLFGSVAHTSETEYLDLQQTIRDRIDDSLFGEDDND